MRKANYEKYPATKITGELNQGWSNILERLKKEFRGKSALLVVNGYTGVYWNEVETALKSLNADLMVNAAELCKPEAEIRKMTAPFITDDVLFGFRTALQISDYFDTDKIAQTRTQIAETAGLRIVWGSGAAFVAHEADVLVYADMARWEIQQRFRRHEVVALGVDNRDEAVTLQYKRGYFNDWMVCDKHKRTLYGNVDFWLDTHCANDPKMIDRDTFMRGIEATAKTPFRVVPFFDPAPWGGQWMKDVCDLDRKKVNYGWCFDCVPEENSLLFEVNGTRFEMPSVNLVYLKSTELLGGPVEGRFGKEFPIRFDFLDTIGGGNLSLQVHPTTQYIRDNFGMPYTQDESYYLLDAEPGAVVYLGVKNGINPDEMISDLRLAQKGQVVFDADKYINKYDAKKHDHYLIPGGTIHCSGGEAMVLEISSTPNLFTFKLWDWERLGLDGKPRPINVEHGKNVIAWERDTDYVKEHLANHFSTVASGDGWEEECTGLHPNEFIETRRHWFTSPVTHHTGDSVNVLNLIEGDEAIVESPTGAFDPFVVHYAETFIIPACLGTYSIRPYGLSEGKKCGTIKASVRI